MTGKPPHQFEISVNWIESSGIQSPEVAATWCQLEVRVNGRTVTLVDHDAPIRRFLYVSAYPLAEWIAFNWWQLLFDMRPSSLPTSNWSWSNVTGNPWLRSHNFRGASGGMPWPDLTIVAEGDATLITWTSGSALLNNALRFVGAGREYCAPAEVVSGLASFVDGVLERLDESRITSRLHEEWRAIRESNEPDTEFNRAVAKLGIDPCSVEDGVAESIVKASNVMNEGVLAEFLDSAHPAKLNEAFDWWSAARRVQPRDNAELDDVFDRSSDAINMSGAERAYERGYLRARRVRQALSLGARDLMPIDRLVSHGTWLAPAGGLEGLTRNEPGRHCSVVLSTDRLFETSVRFAQARALGLALRLERDEYILDPAGTAPMREARAFAAELLAPADGIASYLDEASNPTDQVFARIAASFATTTQLVAYQYENQLLGR